MKHSFKLISVLYLLLTCFTTAFAEDWAQQVDKVKTGIVSIWIHAPDKTYQDARVGTGWLHRDNGTIVTAKHVVSYNTKTLYFVKYADGTEVELQDIKRSKTEDIAVILVIPPISSKDNYVFSLASEDPKQGSPVAALGFPFSQHYYNNGPILTTGNITGKTNSKPVHYKTRLLMSATLNPGHSGSPVFNLDGEVVGIGVSLDSRSPALNLLIPVSTVTTKLKELL